MRVSLIRAWPRRYQTLVLELPAGARLADALAQAGVAADAPCAIYGVRATAETVLADDDRIELLRPLLVDPKEARRRRVQARPAR